jgi:hypothetical protein
MIPGRILFNQFDIVTAEDSGRILFNQFDMVIGEDSGVRILFNWFDTVSAMIPVGSYSTGSSR